jgi:signal transduction histidine kinase
LREELTDTASSQSRLYADYVRTNVVRMNTLIDDLLRLARTTQAEMHRTPVDLSALVREISEKLQAESGNRQGDWIIAPDLTVEGDPGLLRVAMENLLANAWKYTAHVAHARIEFGIELQPDGTPAYYVRDNGAGFDMKFAHLLFAPFQRLHAEREFPGTGIGLATVQRIIQKHGGSIWPEAVPHKGATFYFTLPAAPKV